MIEFYPQVKFVHVAAVVMSGGLFLLRGLALQFGASVANAAPLRYLSYLIDTTLLTAALMLFTMLPSGMFANGWLALKVVLLVVYIVLGTYALKRGRTPATRRITFVAAIFVYTFIVSVARAHHPLGLFAT